MGRKITILGMGMTAVERRIDIEKYCVGEIWGLNDGYTMFPQLRGKWARFHELHSYDYLKDWKPRGYDGCHFKELSDLECDVLVTNHIPLVKQQMVMDVVSVCKHFDTNYFLGSPSMMLMQALYEHDNGKEIEEIRSWGIDTDDPDHQQQRASWAFWIGRAIDRDITLSGSSTNFMGEREKDGGLVGLRESVGDIIVKEQEQAKGE